MKKGEIKKELESQLMKLSEIENMARKDISKAPEGVIYAKRKSKNCCQYYQKNNNTKGWQYIKKSDEQLANELIQKEYAQKVLMTITEQKSIINEFINNYKEDSILNVYNKIAEPKHEKINEYIQSDNEIIGNWLRKQVEIINKASKYTYTVKAGEEIEILTERGESVKSKSEKIIADKMYMMNVPYYYEVPLLLKGYGYAKPDFKILNVASGKEIYWEHFGLMNDIDYVKKAMKKIKMYNKNGFITGKNLIFTFESTECPLDIRNVENIIKETLL